MILSLGKKALSETIQRVSTRLSRLELDFEVAESQGLTLIVIKSDVEHLPGHIFAQLEGVEKVVKLTNRTPAVSRKSGAVVVGGGSRGTIAIGSAPLIIAGPCSVESRDQIIETARAVRAAGARALRGGAFKPRTSPYDFQGLGVEGLKFLAEAGEMFQLPVISEIMDVSQIELAAPYVDMYQVGTRNMYNYTLLKELGRSGKPVLLKRAMSGTIDEFLQSAEYIMGGGASVVLCERGIRTFETRVRNTLDISAVPVIQSLCDLPILIDPSHATGKRDYVRPLSRAAIACGAAGVVLETHLEPDLSISDAAQAITPDVLREIVLDMQALQQALAGRDVAVKPVDMISQVV